MMRLGVKGQQGAAILSETQSRWVRAQRFDFAEFEKRNETRKATMA